jgi:hypothetical protein
MARRDAVREGVRDVPMSSRTLPPVRRDTGTRHREETGPGTSPHTAM